MSDNSGPAFPPHWDPKDHPSGLTKREYFAAASLLVAVASFTDGKNPKPQQVVERAFEYADAMLAESQK